MTKLKDIYEAIDAAAPFGNAMEFDNVGILVGEPEQWVHRAMLALDITRDVILEAISENVDVIISHHPVIFQPIKQLHTEDPVYLLAKHGIAAIACHTNLDMAPDIGVNAALAKALGLHQVTGALPFGAGYLLFTGLLEMPMSPGAFAEKLKVDLGISALCWKPGNMNIKKVCLCSGAGGKYAKDAVETGAEAFVTGEMRYDEMLEAAGLPITVAAAGHYATEKSFTAALLPYLQEILPQIDFVFSQREKNPFETR